MKSIKSCFICFAIMFFGANSSVHAQFLKNIFSNAKQTAQNRSNDKANQVTNKAFDKVDSLTQIKPKHKRRKKRNAPIPDTLQTTGYIILMHHSVIKSDCITVTETALWQNDKYLRRRLAVLMATEEKCKWQKMYYSQI